jgi:hypothetical protein
MQDETCESFVLFSQSCFSLPIQMKIKTLCVHHCGVSTSHLELTDLHFIFRRPKKKTCTIKDKHSLAAHYWNRKVEKQKTENAMYELRFTATYAGMMGETQFKYAPT